MDASNAIGVAVCRIDHEGCTYPSQPCFCQCQGSPCIYWSYWRLASGTWKYSSVGASSAFVRNGDVDGWVWGSGAVSGATPPPAVTFDQVCAPSTATATRTSTATKPPPTNTLSPTNTPVRLTATAAPPTNTFLPPSRTLTVSNVKPSHLKFQHLQLWSPIRDHVKIKQKVLKHTPTSRWIASSTSWQVGAALSKTTRACVPINLFNARLVVRPVPTNPPSAIR